MIKIGSKIILLIIFGIFVIVLPLIFDDPYYLDIMIMAAFHSMLALTWRTIMRIGQLSFGHAAFIGIGAYSSALLVMKLNISFWLALPLSGLITAAISFLVGMPTLRLVGMFFAITTWAFNEIMRSVYLIFKNPFNGSTGLYGIPSPNEIDLPFLTTIDFNGKTSFYYLAIILISVLILVLIRIEHSRIGMRFDAIRGDDSLAESLGINLMAYKCVAFAIASFFAGVAGSFYAHYIGFISPYSFELSMSVDAIVFAMVGGLASLIGPVLGATVLTVISSFLHAAGFFKMILFSVFLVLIILFLPDGMISFPNRIGSLIRYILKKRYDG
jgi:branched-chain amino acid transport system permease protein